MMMNRGLFAFVLFFAIYVPADAADFFNARKLRYYYIKCEKVLWNYLPTGENKVDDYTEYLNDTLVNKADRIGSQYYKYVYKRYTNILFKNEIPSPAYHGLLGPLMKAEVGEVIRLYFMNGCDHPVSIHPHGVRYKKKHKGAHYLDGTSGNDKKDDQVQPGVTKMVDWQVTSEFAPRDGDPNCVPFAYHSHNNVGREENTGLIGLFTVCKQGILNDNDERTDVDKEVVLYFDSVNEGRSLLIDDNLALCGNETLCTSLYNSGDAAFEESLKKDMINGYMYGNNPGLDVCAGERVAYYVFSLVAEIHAIEIRGQTFLYQNQRKAAIGVYSASFIEAEAISEKPGTWLISCMNSEHFRNGMSALLNVNDCGLYEDAYLTGKKRYYYMDAATEDWNYGPSGNNLFHGGSLTAAGSASEKYFEQTTVRIGGTYKKTRFRCYTDANFNTEIYETESDHLGILGCVMRAEVGDEIIVQLRNSVNHPVSLYLQGVVVEKDEDGTWLPKEGVTGKIVYPGQTKTYTFTVPWSAAPGPDDRQCIPYLYYSAYNTEIDVNTGLIGPLLICEPGAIDPSTNRQRGIDEEMFLYFSVIDENHSRHIDDNIATFTTGTVDKTDDDFRESNRMNSINGRMYGNLDGLDLYQHQKVAWHILSFGETDGMHGVAFNGNNVMIEGVYRPSQVIVSGLAFAAYMEVESIGEWAVYCHTAEHYEEGMTAIYKVTDGGLPDLTEDCFSDITRTYYISAEEVDWDYSPNTINPITGDDYSLPTSSQYNRVRDDDYFIGSTYKKVRYIGYTDDTFTIPLPEEQHLGIMGPKIHAGVGDKVKVVFKNAASRPYSIYPMGLRSNKTTEGMVYEDGTAGASGDSVASGATFTYVWDVPVSAGPGPNGPNCIGSIYHSAVDLVKDVYSGLCGPLIICRARILGENDVIRRDSVENEFALLFSAFDESSSWYFSDNLANAPLADLTSAEFQESNVYDSVNGLIYNNVQGLTMSKLSNVAWYVLALGGEDDMHTAHFHGHTYIYRKHQAHEGDVTEVFPGTAATEMMFCENVGVWLLHCHVESHTEDGMIATFEITDP